VENDVCSLRGSTATEAAAIHWVLFFFLKNQEMELTIGSLSILIGPSGLTRLSDPTKPDPSVSEPETVAMMESSEGSSSEGNSPVSLGEAQIAEGDEI
jgi:hypothetical protein